MSRIELASEVGMDFDRIQNSAQRLQEIIEAINVLEHNPLIGRPVDNDKRELVIGRRSHGYVALYRYIAEIDTVFVLAVRGQWEAGYTSL